MLEVARDALRDVTVVKANAAEAAALTGRSAPADAAAALVRLGPRQAIVTIGGEGAVLAEREQVVHVGAEPAHVADATGAGDAVAAVLGAGLARREDVTPQLVRSRCAWRPVSWRCAGRSRVCRRRPRPA